MLKRRLRSETGRKEYALVSRKSGRVLEWFGIKRPSGGRFREAEARVRYHKHRKGDEIA